jgi:hypothetical protein
LPTVPLKRMILRFLFYVFLFYMLYRLVFDFIIPVYRTTKKVKRGFREMNERMRQHTEGFTPEKPQVEKQKSCDTKPGDYIEFEELKD